LTVAQPTGVVDAALDRLLYGQRELDRLGRNGADDRGVGLRSGDALAERIAEQATAAYAHVRGQALVAPSAVADVHVTAAQPAHDAALQECEVRHELLDRLGAVKGAAAPVP
jgi:hypothetical protein